MEGEVILVAVDASKEITDYALEWTVRNVVKAMDSLILLAVRSSRGRPPASANRTHHSRVHQFVSCLQKKWGLGHNEESSSDQIGLVNGTANEVSNRINNVCVQMMRQLCSAHNIMQVHTEVKVVEDAQIGSVAAKAVELGATWVILDRRLKKEGDCCLKQLVCNIILIDHAIPKILRAVNPPRVKKLNMDGLQSDPTVADVLGVLPDYNSVTSTRSSLGIESPSLDTDVTFSLSSTDKDQFPKNKPSETFLHLNSQFFHQEVEAQSTFRPTPSYSKSQPLNKVSRFEIDESPRKSSASSLDGKTKDYRGLLKTKSDMNKCMIVKTTQKTCTTQISRRSTDSPRSSKQLINTRYSITVGNRSEAIASHSSATIDRTSSIRRAMSLSIKQPPTPPPLCSVCKHNAPIFGKALRKFSYKEIEQATDGFSSENFLAEGGYGPVYRGVLRDGQVIAVKQHMMLSAQGASEFCSEVEVLSCAQHRNLVMLVGYCIEIEWLLIYEFACNGSLDKHLYGTERNEVMAWHNRMKVAIGAARGLRYLHEDCRVGCIVHRDFRPNNILLTHDFEPMVGDFGLARWQADGQSAEETRVIGAFGYLAPEYTQTGQITEKTDVYAFGVVLLELLSGFKATELSRNAGQQFLPEWEFPSVYPNDRLKPKRKPKISRETPGRPLLERKICKEIIDPRLEDNYVENEVDCMMCAASLCISPHPDQRPRMSKVLKILEGDMPSDMAYQCRQQSIISPRQKMSGIDFSPSSHLMQSMHRMNLSPSSRSDKINATFNQTKPSDKVVSGDWSLNQPELLVSEEYQAYLQGSLAKFIQTLNQK